MIIMQTKSEDIPVWFKTMVFIKYFEQWHNHWAHCMKSQGDYFERDSIN